LAALTDSRSQLDGRIHGILDKKAKHDALKDELETKAKEQHTLKLELRRLNKIRKQANVERLKRMQEYHRAALNEKLSDEAKRLKELEEQKKELMAKRQQNAINIFKQKEALLKMFQDMTAKRNWESLSKLQLPTAGDGSSGNSHSATNSSGILAAVVAQHNARHGGGSDDDGDDSQNGGGRKRTAGGGGAGGSVNLLDALQGLNKMVNKQKRRDGDGSFGGGGGGGAGAGGGGKKSQSMDDYMKKQSMSKSKSQGAL
jgi:hypothetical protein